MLPSVPDQNGHPRPPAAPWVAGPWRGEFAVRALSLAEYPLIGFGSTLDGPVLEAADARRPDRRRHVTAGALGWFVILAVVMTVVLSVSGGVAFVLLGLAVLAVCMLLFTVLVVATESAFQRLNATAYAMEEPTPFGDAGPRSSSTS